jgi:hypothetical protein
MSDTPSALPPRPSLEQLRKQAKDRLDTMPGEKLADAQFAVARDYGFASWPKLVHHVEALATPAIEQNDRIAHDMVAAYRHGDEDAAGRLNDLFHSAISVDQIRNFISGRLVHRPDGAERLARFDVGDARLLVAGLYGFADWDALLAATVNPPPAETAFGLSTTPPFYRLDPVRGVIAPQQPMSARDWDVLIGVMKERHLTGLEANNLMDDAAMAKLASLPHLTVLKLHGSDRLTDEGTQHLASFPALEELEIGGWNSRITDAGLTAMRSLERLRAFRSWWSRRITDEGLRHLSACRALEDVNLGFTPTGDGLLEALAGMPGVHHVFTGTTVTDAGLAHLRSLPRFAEWRGGEPAYALMNADAGPTLLGIEGPFTAAGLRSLQSLHGLFALRLHWTGPDMAAADLGVLSSMSNLGFLNLHGDHADDDAFRQIGALPRLRMLLAQGPSAGDEGFAALARSQTLEYIWGRECPNLRGRGFEALASIPSIRGLAVSCKQVDEASLAALSRMPNLDALMPMDVSDEGFRHVGRCERLQHLWCMYCRDTGDAATAHLAGLRLRTYYAGLSKITDRSLAILGKMDSLETVQIHHCQGITDAGLRFLAKLPNLREVSVEGSRNVTRKGLAVFPPRVRATWSTA